MDHDRDSSRTPGTGSSLKAPTLEERSRNEGSRSYAIERTRHPRGKVACSLTLQEEKVAYRGSEPRVNLCQDFKTLGYKNRRGSGHCGL